MRRLLALAALVTGLAGCRNTISMGGPPIVICGQTLWSGEMVPVVYQIPPGRGTPLRVPTLTVGSDDFVIVRVAPGCDHGTQVVIEPAGALVVAAEAKARDGELVGVRFSAGSQP